MNQMSEQTLVEIETRYPGQWVLIEETAWDDRGNPLRGVVVAHNSDRKSLVEATRTIHVRKPGAKTFTFYTGVKIPEGVTVIL